MPIFVKENSKPFSWPRNNVHQQAGPTRLTVSPSVIAKAKSEVVRTYKEHVKAANALRLAPNSVEAEMFDEECFCALMAAQEIASTFRAMQAKQ